MTRINTDISPKVLLDQHLFAEWREIKMVPMALRRSMKTRAIGDIIKSIPKKFTLNKGHVTFFYDKMSFLERRYHELTKELMSRGYDINAESKFDTDGIPYMFFRDVIFDLADREILVERIIERVSTKKEWYKMNGKSIDFMKYKETLSKEIQNDY